MIITNNQASLLSQFRAAAVVLISAMVLIACGEGGGAGDLAGGETGDELPEENPLAVSLVQPFVGLYDLPANWSGFPDNDAFLEIQQPDVSGAAVAVIFRQDSFDNCIESRPSFGEVRIDPFLDNMLVLDDIFELEDAILSLTTAGLTITLPVDVQDVDDDGDFNEAATLQAERLGMVSSDLGATCAVASSIIWI